MSPVVPQRRSRGCHVTPSYWLAATTEEQCQCLSATQHQENQPDHFSHQLNISVIGKKSLLAQLWQKHGEDWQQDLPEMYE